MEIPGQGNPNAALLSLYLKPLNKCPHFQGNNIQLLLLRFQYRRLKWLGAAVGSALFKQ